MTEPVTHTALDADGSSVLPITVTVTTVQGWPTIAVALHTIRVAAEAAGGEVIVADGSGHKPPSSDQVGRIVRWQSHPGESIFQLRYRTYQAARGEIVAATEDHVHVPPDWATKMIDAHRGHPSAAAVGGSVTNGATDSVMDWAGFFVGQGPVAAPMRSGISKKLSGAANVSYKRSALEHLNTNHDQRAIDGPYQLELTRRGAILVSDDRIRVAHVQPLGFRRTTIINFHAARTVAGMQRNRLQAADLARILLSPVVPLIRYVRTVALLAPRGYGPLLIRCTPAILWLLYAQGLGQMIGYLAGEGDSPRRLM